MPVAIAALLRVLINSMKGTVHDMSGIVAVPCRKRANASLSWRLVCTSVRPAPESANPEYNEWQLRKMPIKKSFCDSWYSACKADYFRGGGDFFGCATDYKENVAAAAALAAENDDSDTSAMLYGLIVAGVVAVLGLAFAGFLSFREKQGNPVFSNQGSPTGVST